jgi:hypothetical protein
MGLFASERDGKKTNHRHRRLLRARSEWPCRHYTAYERDELASPHVRPQS